MCVAGCRERELSRAEPSRAEPRRAEPRRAKPCRAEPSQDSQASQQEVAPDILPSLRIQPSIPSARPPSEEVAHPFRRSDIR